jgi:hypothetical protein
MLRASQDGSPRSERLITVLPGIRGNGDVRWAYPAALVTVAVLGAVLVLAATRSWGLGVSYDSVVYIQASRDLSSIDLPQALDHGGAPLYWWAPVYPVALKLVGGSYSGARFLNAALLIVGVLLVGGIAWRAIDARAGLMAGAFYAVSPAAFAVHLNLMAEPLFLVLMTASLASIAARRPTLAGLACAVATLTRYSGLPLVAVGAIVFRRRDRLRFLATSVVPYLAWLVRNEVVAGQTTGRLPRWHPPSWQAIEDGLHEVLRLLVTPGQLPSLTLPLVSPGRLAQLTAAAAVLYAVARTDWTSPPEFVRIGLVFGAFYCAFLLLTMAVFDAVVPIDGRLLVPLVPVVAVAMAWLMRELPAVALLLACVFAASVLQQARTVSLYGIDYSGQVWSAARFDGVSLPPGRLLSNWPAAVAYFTGRSPDRLPRPTDAHTEDRNDEFEQDMQDLARRVRTGRASLVLLDGTFLEITGVGTPLAATAPYRDLCRPAGRVITICTRR